MPFELPELPFQAEALEPHISAETLAYHHGKHHHAYVGNLNKLIAGTPYENQSLEKIILHSSGGIFNNAAQHWNHSFYWNALSPTPETPDEALLGAICRDFGSMEKFQQEFTQSAIGNFGSGWTWLVQGSDHASLQIVNTSNAGNPMTSGQKPLFTCDVWEHAYYIDYRNARAEYLKGFWQLLNWKFVSANL